MDTDNYQDECYTVGSLFAGIGGFCNGFLDAGFKVLWANENDPWAIQTYQHNYPDIRLITHSIEELSVVKDNLPPVDVLTAGFPCQPFSVAGNKLGFCDPRGNLFYEIVRLVREYGKDKPKILLMENVKNLLYHDNRKSLAIILTEVQKCGYWFMPNNIAVLNTKDHTPIPQNRERLFMAALSWDVFDFNSFCFPTPVEERDDIRGYLNLERKGEPDLYFDEDGKYGRLFAEKMAGGNPDSIYLLRRWYVRENKDECAFTLTANMGEGGHNVPVIRDEWGIRKLSPTECLRLQGFNAEVFSFPEGMSKSQQYKQIGNAVTASLVTKLAVECKRQLSVLKGAHDG